MKINTYTSFSVWSQIISSLSSVRLVFAENKKVSDALKAFTLKLVTPAYERLGWQERDDEPPLTKRLRTLIITTAGMAGHQG